MLRNPDDIYLLLKLKMALRHAKKQIPPEPHWTLLQKVSTNFVFVIQQLGPELRDAICVYYLLLRAIDTVEDDTSLPAEVRVPILTEFHHHICDPDWHISCGTKDRKVLLEEFHVVSTAFLGLRKSYQEIIQDIIRRVGAGMAKFISKEVETIDDYDEYSHYAAGLVGIGLSKLFHASGLEDTAPDSLSNSMGLFLEKTDIIGDYLEDINELPKPRMFWPRQFWSKYVDKIEDLKYEENSEKAVQCLNDMITNALTHVDSCLKYMSALRDPIKAIGTLALCYNNINVFRGVVKMRRGLYAKIYDETKTMADVYGAFFDFCSVLKSKVVKSDPNATKTLIRLEEIQNTCRESGVLSKRKFYILKNGPKHNSAWIFLLLIALSVIFARLPADQPSTKGWLISSTSSIYGYDGWKAKIECLVPWNVLFCESNKKTPIS